MRKKWMILAGCFFGGILICGLGVGIGFVEFSHFTYAGDRTLGSVKEETLTNTVREDIDTYYVNIPWSQKNGHNAKMVSDNSLPEGTIEIDVVYNDDYEKPYVYEEVWDMPADENDQSGETDRCSYLNICMDADPVKIIMRYKDIILEDIRNDQIGSYSNDWSQSIQVEEVRYHPSLEGKVELQN